MSAGGPLAGKPVVVTGAARGLGAAFARDIAARGGRVLLADRDEAPAAEVAREIVAGGGDAFAVGVDVTDWSAAEGLIEACVARFGAIHGLVNNAGLFRLGKLAEFTEGDVRALMGVNVLGGAFCAAHAVRRMAETGGGAIVNITSDAQAGLPLMSLYGATKAAMASFTYSWAEELQALGVRVNAVSPLAATRLNDATRAYYGALGQEVPYIALPPPEWNAPLVSFLLSDAAAGVTGQVVRLENHNLGLMTHPAVSLPLVRGERWDFDDVAAAFAGPLAGRLQPLGVCGFEAAPQRFASELYGWDAD